jgi:hypothetical protein
MSSIKVGYGVKSEGELVISGTQGYGKSIDERLIKNRFDNVIK